jgi:hypothetical protein
MAAVANLFERLSAGRPQQTKEVAKRQLKNTGLITQWAKDEKIKAFLMEALAKRPVSAIDIAKRSTEQGFTKKQLRRAKRLTGIISFRKGYGFEGRWFWTLPKNAPATVNPQPRFTRRLCNLSRSLGFRLQPIGKTVSKSSPRAVGNSSKAP